MNTFQTRLFDFIEQYHPEMMVDKAALKQFIEERADAASTEYEKATRDGHVHQEAMELSNQTLYKGLDFAPIELLTEIAESNGLPSEETELLAVYSKTKSIFDKYQTETDDFDMTEERELLKTELEQYIKENGLLQETTSAR